MSSRWMGIVCSIFLGMFLWFDISPAFAVTDFNLGGSDTYNAVVGGASANARLGRYNIGYANFDGDGKTDIILTEFSSPHSIYIILGSQIDGSLEQVLDTNELTDFFLRYTPANADEYNQYYTAYGADFDGNGRDELIIANDSSSHGGVNNRGSLYIIYDSILSGYSGTGTTVSLATTSAWNIKILGANADDYIGSSFFARSDLNNDNLPDLVLTSLFTDYSFADAGSGYVIFSTLLNGYKSSTGNLLPLSNSANYHYRIDGPAAASGILSYTFAPTYDYDNDAKDDLLLMAALTDFTESGSGSYYFLSNTLLDDYTGTGNVLSLTDSSDYNLRLDSPEAGSAVGYSLASMGDVNGNNKTDLILTASYATNSPDSEDGTIFLIYDSIFESLTGTGNTIDLTDSSNYTVKYTGMDSDVSLGESTWLGDYSNDGKLDLITHDYYNIYVLDNALLSSYSGTGNTIELGDANTYSYKFYKDGNIFITSHTYADVNGDGSLDFIMDALNETFLTRANADGNYIVLNFPHTFTELGSSHSFAGTAATLAGSVQSTSATTSIAGVWYQVDSTNPDPAGWNTCIAADGNFDSKSERYTCSIQRLGPGVHTVYIRAVDQKGTYSPASGYQRIVVRVNESGASTREALPPQCHAFKPTGVPELFQINTVGTSATIFFSPIRGNTNSYFIRYGTSPSFFEHGFILNEDNSNGVISSTIRHLLPQTTYYFQVRGGNGCMPGDWGNVLKATTTKQSLLQKFYLYLGNRGRN